MTDIDITKELIRRFNKDFNSVIDNLIKVRKVCPEDYQALHYGIGVLKDELFKKKDDLDIKDAHWGVLLFDNRTKTFKHTGLWKNRELYKNEILKNESILSADNFNRIYNYFLKELMLQFLNWPMEGVSRKVIEKYVELKHDDEPVYIPTKISIYRGYNPDLPDETLDYDKKSAIIFFDENYCVEIPEAGVQRFIRILKEKLAVDNINKVYYSTLEKEVNLSPKEEQKYYLPWPIIFNAQFLGIIYCFSESNLLVNNKLKTWIRHRLPIYGKNIWESVFFDSQQSILMKLDSLEDNVDIINMIKEIVMDVFNVYQFVVFKHINNHRVPIEKECLTFNIANDSYDYLNDKLLEQYKEFYNDLDISESKYNYSDVPNYSFSKYKQVKFKIELKDEHYDLYVDIAVNDDFAKSYEYYIGESFGKISKFSTIIEAQKENLISRNEKSISEMFFHTFKNVLSEYHTALEKYRENNNLSFIYLVILQNIIISGLLKRRQDFVNKNTNQYLSTKSYNLESLIKFVILESLLIASDVFTIIIDKYENKEIEQLLNSLHAIIKYGDGRLHNIDIQELNDVYENVIDKISSIDKKIGGAVISINNKDFESKELNLNVKQRIGLNIILFEIIKNAWKHGTPNLSISFQDNRLLIIASNIADDLDISKMEEISIDEGVGIRTNKNIAARIGIMYNIKEYKKELKSNKKRGYAEISVIYNEIIMRIA